MSGGGLLDPYMGPAEEGPVEQPESPEKGTPEQEYEASVYEEGRRDRVLELLLDHAAKAGVTDYDAILDGARKATTFLKDG